MTRQEIFDKVATHLIQQEVPSVWLDAEGFMSHCAYRGPNGTKCAIGCLIPDEKYDRMMEHQAGSVILREFMPELLVDGGGDTFVNSLQSAHDNASAPPDSRTINPNYGTDVIIELRDVAETFDLSTAVLP